MELGFGLGGGRGRRGFRISFLYEPYDLPYRGTSLIICGDSENGRWHVLNCKNVLEKRSVARFQKQKRAQKTVGC